MSGKRGSNPRPPAWKASALSTELFPQLILPSRKWVVMDSNHRSRKTTDLQSAPFGRSGNHPQCFSSSVGLSGLCLHSSRASCRIRTNDPEITNHVLWPTELKRLALSIRSPIWSHSCRKADAKVGIIFELPKLFEFFFIYCVIFP